MEGGSYHSHRTHLHLYKKQWNLGLWQLIIIHLTITATSLCTGSTFVTVHNPLMPGVQLKYTNCLSPHIHPQSVRHRLLFQAGNVNI